MADADNNQPLFNIEKIYIKNASVELPHAPSILLLKDSPEIEVKLTVNTQKVDEEFNEVTVTATVTATMPDKRVLFLTEAATAGIFRMRNLPAEDVDPVLNITCPNILFPYAREAVSDLIVRAGFPPVYLAPLNFEAMYQRTRQQKADSAPAGNA